MMFRSLTQASLFKTVLILTLFLLLLQFFQDNLKFHRQAILSGEVWRIWTGSLVHTNWTHVFINLVGFWILIVLFIDYITPKRLVLYLLLLITGVGLGLWFLSPKLIWYAGLSGALYGLYFIFSILAILKKDYLLGIITLIVTTGKVFWDVIFNIKDDFSESLIDAAVVHEAHTFGLISAFIISSIIIIQHVADN